MFQLWRDLMYLNWKHFTHEFISKSNYHLNSIWYWPLYLAFSFSVCALILVNENESSERARVNMIQQKQNETKQTEDLFALRYRFIWFEHLLHRKQQQTLNHIEPMRYWRLTFTGYSINWFSVSCAIWIKGSFCFSSFLFCVRSLWRCLCVTVQILQIWSGC